ncbi:MAG: DUF438 domain-containing protein [Acidobacteria bacterium]|nr:DUF438 domain-containing protein [Acidobacteriota bacterium]
MSELIDNRAHRIDTLKSIILHLHHGGSADEVRQRLSSLVADVDATEVAAMEQQLIADGMTIDEVRSMCDLHAEVMRDVMSPIQIRPSVGPGHPVDTFQRENAALREAVGEVRRAIDTLAEAGPAADQSAARDTARARVNVLFDIEKHYRRKEELLFPFLERHGITGPSKVMWAKDDEARAALAALAELLAIEVPGREGWVSAVREGLAATARAIEGMIDKEERILLPMALDTLTRDEWGVIWQESPRIGWCLVEPRAGYVPPTSTVPDHTMTPPAGQAILLPTGHVTLEQLTGVLQTMPVDLTFVDADDRVAFYSEGPERVFSRSRAVIGRKVQHCHPPRSVSIVDRILDDFRAGRQSTAEFWIEMHGRFVHIRYFAVRGADAQYLGCLEMTQDVTKIRALQGERRLLAYDDGVTAGAAAQEPGHPHHSAPPPVATATTVSAATPVLAALIVKTIDADAMLAAGTHPLQMVQQGAAALAAGQGLAIDSSFVPKPLIEMLEQGGYDVTTATAPDGRHRTVVRKRL